MKEESHIPRQGEVWHIMSTKRPDAVHCVVHIDGIQGGYVKHRTKLRSGYHKGKPMHLACALTRWIEHSKRGKLRRSTQAPE